jgi:hypothetical protein
MQEVYINMHIVTSLLPLCNRLVYFNGIAVEVFIFNCHLHPAARPSSIS